MGHLLSPGERAQLEALEAHGNDPAIRRRVQTILLYDQGLPTREVAEQAGLSRGRARFWRRRFQLAGMGIFSTKTPSAEPESGAPEGEPSPVAEAITPLPAQPEVLEVDESAAPSPEVAVDLAPSEGEPKRFPESDLAPNLAPKIGPKTGPYPVTLRAIEHQRDLALDLFDATQATHRLGERHRRLLEAAVLLGFLADYQGQEEPEKTGYLYILSNPATNLADAEHKVVNAALAAQSRQFRRRDLAALEHLPASEREPIILAALLRIASALDASGSQSTQIYRLSSTPQEFLIVVEGPQVERDSRAARKRANLWSSLFHQPVRVDLYDPELAIADNAAMKALMSSKAPGVRPDDLLAEAGRKVLGFHFAAMLRHEQGTKEGVEIEELHDMRVATRRMRAAFEVFENAFEPKAIKPHLKGLRATGRALGQVRDLDVFMEKAQHYLDTLPEGQRHGLDPLLAAWNEQRTADRAKMLEHLDGREYAAFKHKFLEFLTTPGKGARGASQDSPAPDRVRQVVPVLVYTRLAAVRAYEPLLSAATLEQLHALRIEFKKLRYTLEYFREVLGAEARMVIEEIKIVQDHLGDLNDANVACQILRDFLDEWETRQNTLPLEERENPEPIVAYLAYRHAERHRLMVTFQDAWAHFDRPELRVKLATAVSVL